MSSFSPQPKLADAIALFEEIGREIFADGIWTCDGGAAVFAYLCEQMGLGAALHVGLYWWPEEKLNEKHLLLEGISLAEGEGDDYWADEHHHWVETWDDDGSPVIIDPNGELRGEGRVVRDQEAIWRYQSKNDEPEHHLVYDPSESWDEIFRYDPQSQRGRELVDERLGLRPALAPIESPAPASPSLADDSTFTPGL